MGAFGQEPPILRGKMGDFGRQERTQMGARGKTSKKCTKAVARSEKMDTLPVPTGNVGSYTEETLIAASIAIGFFVPN